MPTGTVLYFAQLDPVWQDWVQIVNVGNAPAKVVAVARDENGNAIWSKENTLSPFVGWNLAVEEVKVTTSLQVSANQPIVGERHCHLGTQVLDFAGACVEDKTVGRRLFFPELVAGAGEWFRFLNVGNADAHVSFCTRTVDGRIVRQLSHVIPPSRWWQVGDAEMGDIQGTVEVTSTQPIVGERHLHYQGGKTAVGQLGQVLDD
ncbi:hypothetical protein FJZ36_00840 [Candidatus Poribacteria bacterium]|nr:hypothetical protein [Candidatus Poribacteria bacterium]